MHNGSCESRAVPGLLVRGVVVGVGGVRGAFHEESTCDAIAVCYGGWKGTGRRYTMGVRRGGLGGGCGSGVAHATPLGQESLGLWTRLSFQRRERGREVGTGVGVDEGEDDDEGGAEEEAHHAHRHHAHHAQPRPRCPARCRCWGRAGRARLRNSTPTPRPIPIHPGGRGREGERTGGEGRDGAEGAGGEEGRGVGEARPVEAAAEAAVPRGGTLHRAATLPLPLGAGVRTLGRALEAPVIEQGARRQWRKMNVSSYKASQDITTSGPT